MRIEPNTIGDWSEVVADNQPAEWRRLGDFEIGRCGMGFAMGPFADDTRPSADEALARLIDGNRRFLRGEARRDAFRSETLPELAKEQRPYATILGCSDSRVPPEWIFDAGLGELFVVRVAGSILSPEVAGSLQYAGSYLQTPLLVVLGHEGCGAIAAALATKHEGEQFRSRVQLLIASILPCLPDIDRQLSPEEQLTRAVEGTVRWTVRLILDSPEGQARAAEGRMRIVGAVYEIETGRVRLLPADQRT